MSESRHIGLKVRSVALQSGAMLSAGRHRQKLHGQGREQVANTGTNPGGQCINEKQWASVFAWASGGGALAHSRRHRDTEGTSPCRTRASQCALNLQLTAQAAANAGGMIRAKRRGPKHSGVAAVCKSYVHSPSTALTVWRQEQQFARLSQPQWLRTESSMAWAR